MDNLRTKNKNNLILSANPLLDFEYLKKDIFNSFQKIFSSGKYILGSYVARFEKSFAKFNKVKYCVGVSSGTDAIFLAIKSLDIGKGDEIITVSNTASATISAIIQSGAKPILIDINNFYLMDINLIEKNITTVTKAIIPVHLYGQMCEMTKILKIAKKYNLKVIEDCAQSHGASYKKKLAGSLGDIGCYSFYPTKNLSTIGDGGAIVTNNIKLYKRIKQMREYGWKPKFNSKIYGWNSRLDEIHAAILIAKLKKLNLLNSKRKKIAKYYDYHLNKDKIKVPLIYNKKNDHVYHLYVIRVKKRDKLKKYLSSCNIISSVQYPYPIHKQPYFKNKVKWKSLRNSEILSKEILSLPIFPFLENEKVKFIVEKINKYVSK